ncbi:MAG: FAD-dependent thymidylate synthase [Clostridia bacterium]|nr:FAD-dependent thymidylate synthase [Clostridia bacterium]
MKVTLLAHTPEPERLVASAARLCYAAVGIDQLRESQTDESVVKFLTMLSDMGHESPIEHMSFTFGIEGVSRSLLAQITRHRHASFSVQSQRYVREGAFEFVLPPEIEAVPEAKAIYLAAMEEDQRHYDELTAILKKRHTERLLAEGKSQKAAERAAEKMAIEDARFVLPNACHTKMMVTMNARSLLNFFSQRCCNRAQWEIRALATEMLLLVREIAPTVFRKAGPPCLRGACPEGKMTCGQAAEVRARFGVTP